MKKATGWQVALILENILPWLRGVLGAIARHEAHD